MTPDMMTKVDARWAEYGLPPELRGTTSLNRKGVLREDYAQGSGGGRIGSISSPGAQEERGGQPAQAEEREQAEGEGAGG